MAGAPLSSSAAANYLASFQPVRPYEMQSGVLSDTATQMLGAIPSQNAALAVELAKQTLAEAGGVKRAQIEAETSKTVNMYPYKYARKTTLAEKLAGMAALGGGLGGVGGGRRAGRQQMSQGLLAAGGALAHSNSMGNTVGSLETMGSLSVRSRGTAGDIIGGLRNVSGDEAPPLPAMNQPASVPTSTAATPVVSSTPTTFQSQSPAIEPQASVQDQALELWLRRNGQTQSQPGRTTG